ncbi:hypothetical protein [Trinickia fusca]|uniref:GHMP kinase N-terminal domain-containing protein n=1 Tax=Trinickia fusca TaxID=2419777 RepID=A0A494XY83_9BURK|nr:hypothetical protein [Trinickia fusca]RKP52543.1 hypothetical protein D7S89_03285 [Trinickia fusca]
MEQVTLMQSESWSRYDQRGSEAQRTQARAASPKAGLGVGVGVAIGHHGEVLQGGIDLDGNGIRRFLITLPWPTIKSHAKFLALRNSELMADPERKSKSLAAARLTMLHLGIENYGGFLEVMSDAGAGLGMGSSTSDVVASIRAVANAFGEYLNPMEVAKLAVMSEVASDSIMFEDRAVVFCQREGVVLEALEGRLPPAFVIGFNTCPEGGGVSTTHFPLPDYTQKELEAFRPLIGALRAAVRTQSVQLMGNVATASAKINQRFLKKNRFEELLALADANGACGLQVAHSGTVAGFLLDPRDRNIPKHISAIKRGLAALGIHELWYFDSSWETQ